jgi:hypothetical protein
MPRNLPPAFGERVELFQRGVVAETMKWDRSDGTLSFFRRNVA